MKADSKTIQAIHDAVITHNRRVSISGDLFTTFNLHIAQIEEKDRGEYMCQINTDPMTYQAGYCLGETLFEIKWIEFSGNSALNLVHIMMCAPFPTDGVPRRDGSARHHAVDDRPRVAAGGDGEPRVQGGRLPLAHHQLAERGGPAHSGQGP